jgi:1,4-alpha-glucan branching enzyme
MRIINPSRLRNLVEQREQPPCSASFEFYAPSARKVFLVGEFNDWNARATPMLRSATATGVRS